MLRRIRRATLATLRREVEPAEQAALGRFLPSWHGIGRRQTLREALVPLQALPLPVPLWESEVLPRRVPSYRPADLDALCASGEMIWVGAGLDRVAVYFREDAAVLGRPAAEASPDEPANVAVRAALAQGALFWPDLVAVAGLDPAEALAALWDLVWAGEVTNDSWAPLRASRRYEAPRPERRARRFARARATGASPTQGRWGLTTRLFPEEPDRRALAELLLERQGIVTRDGVRGEGVRGGYGAVYGELRALETLGSARRGYFVEGLGGAQFAPPGAVERLRELRAAGREDDEPSVLVLAAADPAQPYGAALPGRGAPAHGPRAWSAPGSCSWTARRRCTSSAAVGRSCRSATRTRAGFVPRSTRSLRMYGPAGRSGLRSSASTASPSSSPTRCSCSSTRGSSRGRVAPCSGRRRPKRFPRS